VYECTEVNRSATELVELLGIEAMRAVSPFGLIRPIYGILTVFLPKDHHRAHAAVASRTIYNFLSH
jgi:hypothetical protein